MAPRCKRPAQPAHVRNWSKRKKKFQGQSRGLGSCAPFHCRLKALDLSHLQSCVRGKRRSGGNSRFVCSLQDGCWRSGGWRIHFKAGWKRVKTMHCKPTIRFAPVPSASKDWASRPQEVIFKSPLNGFDPKHYSITRQESVSSGILLI